MPRLSGRMNLSNRFGVVRMKMLGYFLITIAIILFLYFVLTITPQNKNHYAWLLILDMIIAFIGVIVSVKGEE